MNLYIRNTFKSSCRGTSRVAGREEGWESWRSWGRGRYGFQHQSWPGPLCQSDPQSIQPKTIQLGDHYQRGDRVKRVTMEVGTPETSNTRRRNASA